MVFCLGLLVLISTRSSFRNLYDGFRLLRERDTDKNMHNELCLFLEVRYLFYVDISRWLLLYLLIKLGFFSNTIYELIRSEPYLNLIDFLYLNGFNYCLLLCIFCNFSSGI